MEHSFDDRLVASAGPDLPERYFDRFVFNLHPTDATAPSVLLGLGMYPTRDVVDGFAILVTESEQRNVRYSTQLSTTEGDGAGPFRFEVVEPMQQWHLALGPNATGLELDVTWRARTPAWIGDVAVANQDGTPSSFEHLVQSGLYEGTATIDGAVHDVTGWYGQRDRSRGVRTMSGGQGLHLWFQAQFPDRSVGFLLVENRDHDPILLEGAVMHISGELDDIVGVRHELRFDQNLDLRSGRVEVMAASGAVYQIGADASAGGGYLSGGWYGGQHGRRMGRDYEEHDVYPLDGSVSPLTVDSALTDRLTRFSWGEVVGYGIFEFAHSRSRSYAYRPSL
jgi:hypothetical protein